MDVRAAHDYGFNDWSVVDIGIVVHGKPEDVAENRASPDILQFEWSAAANQQFDCIEVSAACSHVEASHAVSVLMGNICTLIQKEINDTGAAELAGPNESGLYV